MTYKCVFTLCASLVLTAFAFAQTGSLSGTANLGSGGALSNATIILENLDTGAKQQMVTDASGKYEFNNLAPGRYRLTTSTAQFTGAPSQEIVIESRAKTVNITVQGNVATAVATVTPANTSGVITETTPALDMTGPKIQSTYNTRSVQYLPQSNLVSRNGEAYGAYNLSLLSPSVLPNPGFGPGRGPVVGGMRPTSNNFNIEGIDNNNRVNPGPLVYLSNEATTEFTFFQNQFPPEYGHAAGGQFNSTIRTGTRGAGRASTG